MVIMVSTLTKGCGIVSRAGRQVCDSYGRPVTNLRISLTQRCNLNCFYCHREGESISDVEMTPDEIDAIVGVATEFGICRFKITGGEPLLREDIGEIIPKIASKPEVEEISMTTNGSFLAEKAEALAKAGLHRVNVSLDSTNPLTYNRITGGGDAGSVIKGIKAAIKAGLGPVKINMVILQTLNESDITEMIEFAREAGAVLQLIELVSVGMDTGTYLKYHYDLRDVEDELSRLAQRINVRRLMHNRKIYLLPGVKVEVVRPMDNTEFCAHCTRIRLTSDGKLKPCLMRNDNLVDILTPLRSGASRESLRKLFLEAVMRREPYFKPWSSVASSSGER